MKAEVYQILENNLPKGFNLIVENVSIMGSSFLKIMFSPNTHEINNVKGQFPDVVSLCLDLKTLELGTQVWGGNGGGKLYLKPDLNDPREKYLCYASVKVSFRKPKATKEAVLKAVERFCINYIKTMKENRNRLGHPECVDYSFLD